MSLCNQDLDKCRCFSPLQLPRMYCTICYQSNLPERKFKKKARQNDSGICLPCQGAVNRHYSSLIGRKRKPGKSIRNQAWNTAIEAARMELCPGYADSVAALNAAKVATSFRISQTSYSRPRIQDSSELVSQIEIYVFLFCKGPHCRKKPLALLDSEKAESIYKYLLRL